jgi:DNA-binding winged helix-turn-helix (wHTH) protein
MSQDGSKGAANGRPARVFEYRFGAYRVRCDDLILRYHNTQLPVAPKVASTLLVLLDNAGRFLSKDELLRSVWGEATVEEANLSQNIYSLRRLFDHTSGDAFIETLPKRGYRFNQRVTKHALDAAEPTSSRARWSFLAAFAAIATCVVIVNVAAGERTNPKTTGLSGVAENEDALGWYYWRGSTAADLRASIQHFRRVAQTAPHDPEGYAGEAIAYAKLADLWGGSPSGLIAAVGAEKLSRQAVATDPKSAIGRAARGFVELDTDGDLDAAAADLRFAVAADPNLSVAHNWYGAVLLYQGDLAGAQWELTKTTSLDSTLPGTNYLLALDYYLSRDYQDAIAYAKLETSSAWFSQPACMLLAAAHEETGQYALALGDARQLHANDDDALVSSSALAQIYASMGWHERARSELAVVERLAATDPAHPLVVALAYAANEHPSEAFAWLSRMPQSSRTFAGLDPRLDPLRHDPRFSHWIHG